ncbi:hypothetical protein KPH14_003031 [Odynerus spinipes]|uniref:Uncharacterized protein n=1 Tax=Odynerus spinipes TaxID=1348599 RepID=A0AAD9VV64_9HYME|nr:hypothetical protein KPH14_003031 [Odynerus spinipes]
MGKTGIAQPTSVLHNVIGKNSQDYVQLPFDGAAMNRYARVQDNEMSTLGKYLLRVVNYLPGKYCGIR